MPPPRKPLTAYLPSVLQLPIRFTAAMFKWSIHRFAIVSIETFERRVQACSVCPYREKDWKPFGRCGVCGCNLYFKIPLPYENCPAPELTGEPSRWLPKPDGEVAPTFGTVAMYHENPDVLPPPFTGDLDSLKGNSPDGHSDEGDW